MTEEIPKILKALFVEKTIHKETFEQATAAVQALGTRSPVWLKALANGNRNLPDKLRDFVVEEFCIYQLEVLGYRVKIERLVDP